MIYSIYKAYQPGSSHHQTHEGGGSAHCYSRQSRQPNTACKVHVGGVDPVLHILRPDPAQSGEPGEYGALDQFFKTKISQKPKRQYSHCFLDGSDFIGHAKAVVAQSSKANCCTSSQNNSSHAVNCAHNKSLRRDSDKKKGQSKLKRLTF